MQDLTVTVVQTSLIWENAEANLSELSNQLANITATDVIILPEMFTSGFSMNVEELALLGNKNIATDWMLSESKKHNAAICGSIIVKENDCYYNRLYFVSPDGKIEHYSKRHLFRMASEHNHFTAGTDRLIVEYKGWRICPLVCYDLRFPVWSRNMHLDSRTGPVYDILIYVANWPAARKAPWQKLLMARAIENQVYTVGVNRIGKDAKGIEYCGASMIIDPKGDEIVAIPLDTKICQSVTLSASSIINFREKFPISMDADTFTVK